MAMAMWICSLGLDGYPSNCGKGRSYVVFGGPGIGNSGTIALSVSLALMALNSMGKIMVIRAARLSAPPAISMAMGHADFLIGAFGCNAGKGRSYVVFGGPGVGSQGMIPLSVLNGSNGFKLDGEAT